MVDVCVCVSAASPDIDRRRVQHTLIHLDCGSTSVPSEVIWEACFFYEQHVNCNESALFLGAGAYGCFGIGQ